MIADQSWLADAACRGKPTSWWFPTDPGEVGYGAHVCAACPVRTECEAAGRHEDGTWGGVAQRARRAASGRRPSRHAPCGTAAAFERHRYNDEAPCEECRLARNAAARRRRAS